MAYSLVGVCQLIFTNFHQSEADRSVLFFFFFSLRRGSAFTFKNLRFVGMFLNIDLFVYLFILIGLLGYKPGRISVIFSLTVLW